jgi:hypothetical protein
MQRCSELGHLSYTTVQGLKGQARNVDRVSTSYNWREICLFFAAKATWFVNVRFNGFRSVLQLQKFG